MSIQSYWHIWYLDRGRCQGKPRGKFQKTFDLSFSLHELHLSYNNIHLIAFYKYKIVKCATAAQQNIYLEVHNYLRQWLSVLVLELHCLVEHSIALEL